MKNLVNNFKWWTVIGALGLAGLAGCGGGSDDGDSAGQIRLVNATSTHASIDLVKTDSDDTNQLVSAVAADTVSDYVDLGEDGSTSLQIRDAGGTTSLVSTSASVDSGDHHVVVAYESNGTVRTASIAENTDEPNEDTVLLRVINLAVDAGALDVYVTAADVDLASVTRNFGITASSSPQTTGSQSFTPGTYRIRVTASGSKTDLRIDVPAVELGNQQVAAVLLTPTVGGILLNGSVLVQEGAYTAARNANARVRVLAALADNATVTAKAGSTTLSSAAVSPAIGVYATVPASAALSLAVDGDVVTLPSSVKLIAGADTTLMVHGSPADPTIRLITDDNHLPTSTSDIKMRLVNALTGTTAALSLAADFTSVANSILPGAASGYTQVPGNESMRLDVTSSSSATAIYSESDINVQPNGVWTLFMIGDGTAPGHVLVRDR